jgi:putative ABC transport system ATP-binding protein
VREALHDRLAEPSLAALVEPFDPTRYNRNMSVAENLLFGTPVGNAFATDQLAHNAHVRATLERVGVMEPLLAMGQKIAETMVELFADLPPGHPFFEQFSFIAAEDLPEFRALLARIGSGGPAALNPDDRAKLLSLAFPYVEARHRLSLIDDAMERRLLEARRTFAETLPADLAGAVEFYDEKRYNTAATLQDNILFGRLVYGQAQAATKIGQAIVEVLMALDLRSAVLGVGLDYNVGIGGKRLTAVQRQKVGLARALVKRPDLLVVNEATAVFDVGAQARIMDRIAAQRDGRGILWVLHRPDLARKMHRVVVLQDGKIVEQGKVSEVDRPGTAFSDLVAAE